MANRRDAERQVDELQTLVAALNAQIQGMHAQLEVREKEVRELSARVDEYRARESAIVVAMTDTQEACRRRIADAEKQAQNIITNANEQSRLTLTEAKARMQDLEKRAKQIETDANMQAERIIAKAKEMAARRTEQSGREASEFAVRLGKLKCELKLAIEHARSSADSYIDSLDGTISDVEKLEQESRELKITNEAEQKEYDNAALFIRDMYRLEGRGIPGEEQSEAPEALHEEERVWTVDEIIASQSGSDNDAMDEALRETRDNAVPEAEEPPEEQVPIDMAGLHWTGPNPAEPKDPFKRNSIFPDIFEDDKDDQDDDPIDIDSLLDELME